MNPLKGLLISCVLAMIYGCSHPKGTWVWRHSDPHSQIYKSRDIAQCEQYAGIENMGAPGEIHTARDYGGWGDFSFEFCMQERGWDLQFIPLEERRQRQ